MNALFPDLVVNGEPVPHAEIALEVQNHEGPKGKPGVAWRKAAHAMAVRTLLLQEARKQGIAVAPQEVGLGRFETEEEALIRGLLDLHVHASSPTEDEVEAYWARDPDRFRAPPVWDVSHILVACDPRDAEGRDAAKKQALYLTERAISGEEKFAAIAETHSDCGSRSTGGLLGQMTPGDAVPEFEAALRDMSDGDITAEPVLSRHGWHVIRLNAVARGEVLPFDTVRPRIAAAMEKARWARASLDYVTELMADADIQGLPTHPGPVQ